MQPPVHTGYRAPWWLLWPDHGAGHLHTIWPARFITKPPVHYRRERWVTPDDDFIDVDYVDSDQPHAPLVVMFHGLEGSSHSHYARALMHAIKQRDWLGAVPHFRGCSGESNRHLRAYHSGDAEEVGWIVRRFRTLHPQRPLYVAGVSLGGNAMLRWLGESREAAHLVERAAAISAPLDLMVGGHALSQGLNHAFYTRMFLRTLKQKTLIKAAQHPGLIDVHTLGRARNLYEFDDAYTAPVHGYLNAEDYWRRASAKPILDKVEVPTLVLNAKNDPFLPAFALPQVNQVSARITLEQPNEGGHVGFTTGPFPGTLNWLPERILRFFQNDCSNAC